MTKDELYEKIRNEDKLQFHSKFYKTRLGNQVGYNNYQCLIKYAKQDNRKGFNSLLRLFEYDFYIPLEVNYDLSEEQVHDYMFLEMKYNLDLEETLSKIPDRRYIQVEEGGKYGLVNSENEILIPFEWDFLEKIHKLYFCAKKEKYKLHIGTEDRLRAVIFNTELEASCDYILKWGVFDHNCNLIVSPQLDEKPIPYDSNGKYLKENYSQADYYLIKINDDYGLLRNNGDLLAEIELKKSKAIALILEGL